MLVSLLHQLLHLSWCVSWVTIVEWYSYQTVVIASQLSLKSCFSCPVICEDGIPRDLRAGLTLFPEHCRDNIKGVTEAELRALEIPVSGLMGELDPERKYLERLLDIMPGFRFTIIPGADHMQAGDSVEYREFILRHLGAATSAGGPSGSQHGGLQASAAM